MTALGGTFRVDLLKLIFWGTAIANLADNAASSPLTNLQVALHTADPGPTGDQTTSELTYTSYARVAVARTSSGWVLLPATSVLFDSVGNAADITFPSPSGAAGQVATYASIGFAHSGASKIICRGLLNGPVTIAVGNAPIVKRGSTFSLG